MNQKPKMTHNSRNQKSITQHYLRMNSPKNVGVFGISPVTFFQKSTQVSKTKMASPAAFNSTMNLQQLGSASGASNSRNLNENPSIGKPSIPSMFHRRNTHFGNVPLLSLKEAAATAAASTRAMGPTVDTGKFVQANLSYRSRKSPGVALRMNSIGDEKYVVCKPQGK